MECKLYGLLILSLLILLWAWYLPLSAPKPIPVPVPAIVNDQQLTQLEIALPPTPVMAQPSNTIDFYSLENGKGDATLGVQLKDVYKMAETNTQGVVNFSIQSINAPLGTYFCIFTIYDLGKPFSLDDVSTTSSTSYKRFFRFWRPIRSLKAFFAAYPELTNLETGFSLSTAGTHCIVAIPDLTMQKLQIKKIGEYCTGETQCLNYLNNTGDLLW
jgi:hypothetical protein